MNNYFIILLFVLINLSIVLSQSEDCDCCLEENYFNESIFSQHISIFDIENIQNQPVLYNYNVNCPLDITDRYIDIEYKFVSPEIGVNTFETFFTGEISNGILSTITNFTNKHIESGLISNVTDNDKLHLFITYISQSGKLPNGKYLYHFSLKDGSSTVLDTETKIIEISEPMSLELLYPGGLLSEINSSFTHSTLPQFSWYSDYCVHCDISIRICEYDRNIHESLEEALNSPSIVPIGKLEEYLLLDRNINSFQYPIVGHPKLEIGKFYVWQIRRSYGSTLGIHYDYSPIYIFEVRFVEISKLNKSTDQYLLVIESIIGSNEYNKLFGSGGELERFSTNGDMIWVDGQEKNISELYLILSELKQKNLSIGEIKIK